MRHFSFDGAKLLPYTAKVRQHLKENAKKMHFLCTFIIFEPNLSLLDGQFHILHRHILRSLGR